MKEDMVSLGISPDRICYNAMMDSYAKKGDVENIMKLRKSMEMDGISPDVVTFSCMMLGLFFSSMQSLNAML
jgi:pentatricopeptide repeat protein